MLKLKFSLGLFEAPYGDPLTAAREARNAEHLALAHEGARKSIVLLKNERNTLPLGTSAKRILVIGSDAVEGRPGGYSPPGARITTILDGLRAGAPKGTTIRYAAGVPRVDTPFVAIPAAALRSAARDSAGVDVEYFDNITLGGRATIQRTEASIEHAWTLSSPGAGIPLDWYSARWSGAIVAPATGVRAIAVEGNDGYRLWIDGRLVIDNWRKASFGMRSVFVNFVPESRHAFRLEYFETAPGGHLTLKWQTRQTDRSDSAIAAAVTATRVSDAAIVVAGIEEGEFRDRARLALPGRQEELIRRVAATGRPVIVVLVGGSAITMPWLDRVGAVIDAWYAGAEGGNAIADVLFGRVSPSGRLPITFPMEVGQLPLYYAHKPTGRGDDYLDLTGSPLFPFGHGLTYTSFAYDGLRVYVHDSSDSTALTVRFTVRNTGRVASDEVAQLYLHQVLASVARPIIELAGFARIPLAPGESREVTLLVQRSQLSFLNEQMQRVVEPGEWRVMVGASSRDIRLRAVVDVR